MYSRSMLELPLLLRSGSKKGSIETFDGVTGKPIGTFDGLTGKPEDLIVAAFKSRIAFVDFLACLKSFFPSTRRGFLKFIVTRPQCTGNLSATNLFLFEQRRRMSCRNRLLRNVLGTKQTAKTVSLQKNGLTKE